MITMAEGATGSVRCHCCGRDTFQTGHLTRVYGGGDTGIAPLWSCEKHRGRIPCLIEGCGRTYALEPGERYGVRVVCGRHWRQAPKRMRDAVARVRRIARKRGWDDLLYARFERLWERTVRAITEPPGIDLDEIERLFGDLS